MISIAVVDDHDSVRDNIAAMVADATDLTMVGGYQDLDEFLGDGRIPNVLVLDMYLARDSISTTVTVPLLVERGSVVVLHTAEEHPAPLRLAVQAGVSGVSLKHDGIPALLDVVREAWAGQFVCSSVLARALVTDPALAAALSTREIQVLRGVDDGLTARQVAKRMGISEKTIGGYLKSVRTKYQALGRDLTNSKSLAREARRDGWIRNR